MLGPKSSGTLCGLLVAMLAVAGGACSRVARPNVVLISIDTLRPDHLGCYGYRRNTSPALDAFRTDAVLFSRVAAQAPSTLTSHASIFTSLIPTHHGASHVRGRPLAPEAETLAETLMAAGWRTAAFTGGGQLDPAYGVGQGFEVYQHRAETLLDSVESALGWLDGGGREPFFLFLHTYEVHHPYTPRGDLLARLEPSYAGSLPAAISVALLKEINRGERVLQSGDLEHIVSTYDAEIRSMDEAFGRLMAELRSRSLYDDALIVFTSDHGEEFGEHGWVGWHSHTLFEELLRVPLLVKFPRGRHGGARVESRVRGIDVAPTILDVAGVAAPVVYEGVSFAHHSEGEPRPQPSVSTRVVPRREVSTLVVDRWKWTAGRLYDLTADPGETVDLSIARADVAHRMRARLKTLLESRAGLVADRVAPDAESEARLRALGYLD